jgi:hypothetical protein
MNLLRTENTPSRISALLILSALLGLSIFLESCTDQCQEQHTYIYYEPEYTPLSVIRSSIAVEEPRPIGMIGKIYFKDDYLFVNEPGEGIHVIDNHDPEDPQPKYFINVPGNYDLAIRNSILFVDSYIDLVALDISNLDLVHEVGRLENIFNQYSSMGFYVDPIQGMVTNWVEKSEVEVTEPACDAPLQPWGGYYYDRGIVLFAEMDVKAALTPGNTTPT